jgi:hypothetical protein
MRKVDFERQGLWRELFSSALRLMDHLEAETHQPQWTFGGGTVLMLRFNHRMSKDIDLFVTDPQYLGYLNPRLSDVAESITHEYVEGAEYIKLLLPIGEIDVVVGAALTEEPTETLQCEGRSIRVETSAEIIAKKMWHRGDRAKARDLFDLCAVHAEDPVAIRTASPFFEKHGHRFIELLHEREDVLRLEFDTIDALDFSASFDECVETAKQIILGAPGHHGRQRLL